MEKKELIQTVNGLLLTAATLPAMPEGFMVMVSNRSGRHGLTANDLLELADEMERRGLKVSATETSLDHTLHIDSGTPSGLTILISADKSHVRASGTPMENLRAAARPQYDHLIQTAGAESLYSENDMERGREIVEEMKANIKE